MKALKIIAQWLGIIGLIAGAWYGWRHFTAPQLPVMPGYQVLFFALAIAFTWVEVLKWGVIRPFTCVKCMTGWAAPILALVFHTPLWSLYLPAGLFIGAIYSAIKMRWL